jgi:hypothetical protein
VEHFSHPRDVNPCGPAPPPCCHSHLEHDQIAVKSIQINGKIFSFEPLESTGALIKREQITTLTPERIHQISVFLGNL